MAVSGARQRIEAAVLAWPGVVSQPHRFGGTEFVLGKREVGHVHGDRLLDIAFPKPVRNEVVAAGLAEPHHILPDSGWVSFYITKEEDVAAAVALLRRSYDLAREQQARKYGTAARSSLQ
ncbi:MAG TPA: luciferase family protein [Thermoanaerobaculia bacterium]|nr:luciferase family protein [Thermoanaerobaculia bacterium]